MKSSIAKIEEWFKLDYEISSPIIIHEYCKTEVLTMNVRGSITGKLNRILQECKINGYRLGITGRAPNKIEKASCKKEKYSRMFLMYKTKNKEYVFQLERHYQWIYNDDPKIVRYGGDNDFNITQAINGFYYFFLLV